MRLNRIAVILLAAAFAVYAAISLGVFRDYPFSMDEYNYRYQAEIFASGRLHVDAPPWSGPLIETHTLFVGGKVSSKYPPLFSVILTPTVLLGVSGLVNPLISVISLYILFLILGRLFEKRIAGITCAIAATNIYFVGYAASYFAQSLTLLLCLLSLLFLMRHFEKPSSSNILLSAVFLAGLVLTRPLDAVLHVFFLAVITFAKLKWSREFFKTCVVLGAGIALGTLLLMTYNHVQSGSFALAGYPLWEKEFTVNPRGASIWANYLQNGRKFFGLLLGRYFLSPLGAGAIALCLAGVLFGRSVWARGGLLYLLAFILAYNFHSQNGWPQYGSRYWYPGWIGIALMTAAGVRALEGGLSRSASVSRFLPAVLTLLLVSQVYWSGAALMNYRSRFDYIFRMREIAESHCPEQSIIPLEKLVRKYQRAAPPYAVILDLRRNPFLNGSRLYVNSEASARELERQLPGYHVCTSEFADELYRTEW